MRLFAPFVIAGLLAAPIAAHAQLNKCVGADGKVSYQSEPCPQTSKSQSVQPPPPGPSSSGGQGASGADGWDPARLERMCGRLRARARYVMRGQHGSAARADPKVGAFPAGEFNVSAEAFCTCLVGRVRVSLKPSEFEAKGLPTMTRFAAEALEGGQCKPVGILGRILAGHS